MKIKKLDNKKQGKLNRQSGARFELFVRKDYESKGWIVSKWMNNVELFKENGEIIFAEPVQTKPWGKLIPAKHKFRGLGIPMAIGTGFPDFIAFKFELNVKHKNLSRELIETKNLYEIIFVEVKTNGYLSKEEKEKAKFYLKNNFCSKFLIAKKIKVGRKVVVEYKEFKCVKN